MKYALAFAVLFAAPVHAQDFGVKGGRMLSADAGIGAVFGPAYPGAKDSGVTPWIIRRNAGYGPVGTTPPEGFRVLPSFGFVGSRDSGDDDGLAGLDDINNAFEVGLNFSYSVGQMTAYGTVRQGFDGHKGLTGEVGARHRFALNDRITFFSGGELVYGSDDFNDTYFGVTPAESLTSGFATTAPGGGFNLAALTFEASYAVSDTIALVGEVRVGKLIGDSADSPVVQDEYQRSLRLGITRRISFGF